MNCNRVQRELEAWCDGELPPYAAWRVARHLRRCPGCTEAVQRWRRWNLNLSAANPIPEPAVGDGSRPTQFVSRPLVALAAGALAVSTVAGVWIVRRGAPVDEPTAAAKTLVFRPNRRERTRKTPAPIVLPSNRTLPVFAAREQRSGRRAVARRVPARLALWAGREPDIRAVEIVGHGDSLRDEGERTLVAWEPPLPSGSAVQPSPSPTESGGPNRTLVSVLLAQRTNDGGAWRLIPAVVEVTE